MGNESIHNDNEENAMKESPPKMMSLEELVEKTKQGPISLFYGSGIGLDCGGPERAR